MGVRILKDTESGYSCMYCSTTMIVFGSIFYEDEDAEDFLIWLEDTTHKDARAFEDPDLKNKISEWRRRNEPPTAEQEFIKNLFK